MQSYKEIVTADTEENPGKSSWSIGYLLNCPWAHPLWDQYLLLGYSLDGSGEIKRYRSDTTHEVLLYALGKECPVKPAPLRGQKKIFLQPANCGYQLTTTNEKLVELLDSVVERIEHVTMSPDTDFRWQWDDVFIKQHGAVTLLQSAWEPANQTKN
jgi:hypothetical protein